MTTQENPNASAATTAQPEIVQSDARKRAFQIALGNLIGNDVSKRTKGAENDYNSRGNGSTMARRVLRGGSWEWLSAPASRNRYLASDRKDVQYGDAYEGEIVAEYTLGGSKAANHFYIVIDEEKHLLRIDSQKIKTGYRLTKPGIEAVIEVSDPYWK